MLTINRRELEDKIYACWLGKNIGGTLGGPFENRRELLDIKGFTTEPGNPLPNDDLDLQLIWLKAVREQGIDHINERVLGEYWMECISPFWNEYGVCKGNMARGLVPPISGEYNNGWKHSNGAWIRTEIWACLLPGLVEEAIRCSYMDACVDHGLGEGTYAAIFVAALESAAFFISDLRTLLDIGLSKIPAECRTHKFITMAINAYDANLPWQEARKLVTDATLADPELGWFQAPANVAYAVIGLLYGAGDFKKTLLTAVNCGDDTDCSAATAGSILGIMHGTSIIPEDWKAYIGDSIVTVAVNIGATYGSIPPSCTDLTNRILALHPAVLTDKPVRITEGETQAVDAEGWKGTGFADSLAARSPYSFQMDFVISSVTVEYDRAPDIRPNGEIGIKVTIANRFLAQKHFELEFLTPDGWSVEGDRRNITVEQRGREPSCAHYVLHAGENVSAKNRMVLQITCEGHPDVALLPLVLLG